jgi:hypothetical protein
MFKKHLLHGHTAGFLSGVACYVYYTVLKDEFMYDFSKIISVINLFGACMFGTVLASIGHFFSLKFVPKYGEIIFNVLFALFVFASLISPMTFKLPLDFDEYLTVIFPTYAMTMHFFPVIIWYATKPIFIR